MALDRSVAYPGFFDNPTSTRPQGAFKNETAEGAEDGSYLEQDWLNDVFGFHDAILAEAGETPNGTIDEGGNSQVLDALKTVVNAERYTENLAKYSAPQNFNVEGTTGDALPTSTGTAYALDAEFTLGRVVTSAISSLTLTDGVLSASDGSYSITYNQGTDQGYYYFIVKDGNGDYRNADDTDGLTITRNASTTVCTVDFTTFTDGVNIDALTSQQGRTAAISDEDSARFVSGRVLMDVLSSRALSVDYKNTTAETLTVYITTPVATAEIFTITVGGEDILVADNTSSVKLPITFNVSPGVSYSVSGTNLPFSWYEESIEAI